MLLSNDEPIKKTSEEWQSIFPYPKVLDHDGWDRKNFDYSWKEEKITLEEYENRLSNSTCMFWTTAKTIKM
jgi:hypothetical protein